MYFTYKLKEAINQMLTCADKFVFFCVSYTSPIFQIMQWLLIYTWRRISFVSYCQKKVYQLIVSLEGKDSFIAICEHGFIFLG